MTFGASSAMFSQFLKQALGAAGGSNNVLPTTWAGLVADSGIKVALYNDTTTPAKDGSATTAAYNGAAGPWVTANEVADGTNWDAAGEPLTSKAITAPGSGVVMYDGADTPQSGASTTLANVYGCLVYDQTVTANTDDFGITFHSFGGAQSVTGGTFTVVWHANGLFRITV